MDTQTRNPLASEATMIHNSAKMAEYQRIVTAILLKLAQPQTIGGEIQTIPVFDELRHHYQILDIGWDVSGRRVFHPIVHVDLIDEKVWIQENTTDSDIAEAFVMEGIERSCIVLGLYSRSHRELSCYAVD
jgi:XisI protein